MNHAITVGDVLLWSGGGLAIVIILGGLVAIIAAYADGFNR